VSDEIMDQAPVYLSAREARTVERLMSGICEDASCEDASCGDQRCADIRRTVNALKRLIAKLALVRAALENTR
jgi:hypothetical protein